MSDLATASFSAEEIVEICQGRLASGMFAGEIGAVCTDTRSLVEGQWYLALAGERFDGHDFLGDAFSAGALGAIVGQRAQYAVGSKQFPLIAVEDTLEAYHALARNWRKRINPKVVAVTGSSGKTTTKEMCAAVFSDVRRCHSSVKNENNEIGVPKTLLMMPDDTQVAVVEMAMRGLGQIDVLARCALPDVAIITNVGTAHIELLGSRENIARAKCEVLASLHPSRGLAILGSDDPLLLTCVADQFGGRVRAWHPTAVTIIDSDEAGTKFRIEGVERTFHVACHGIPLLQDAWCAITAGLELGLTPEEVAAGLDRFQVVTGRGNKVQAACGAVVLDESYNANPDSVRAAVLAMLDSRAFPQRSKVLVLGELAELGDHTQALSRELGNWLKEKPLSTLITVGRLARAVCDGASGAPYEIVSCSDMVEAESELRRRLTQDSCVLIKGSRAAKLDHLVAAICRR